MEANMTKEDMMYEILAKISGTEAPLVFKGALITKLILKENNFDLLERMTKDIDANWIGTPPTLDELVEIIKEALGDLCAEYTVIGNREHSENKTAGIRFYSKENERLFTMDVNMNSVMSGVREYFYGQGVIKGVLVDEILADKISVLSANRIFRRAKDLIDVYAFSDCVEVNTHSILAITEQKGRVLGDFDEFVDRKNDLEHAYNKLRGVEGKPDFAKVYEQLATFLEPFVEKNDQLKTWDSHTTSWSSE